MISSQVPLRIALERDVSSPGIARTAISRLCDDGGIDGSVRQTLLLLVSELVSNAVLHSSAPVEAPIELSAAVGEQAISVAVIDGGNGFTPREREPGRRDGGYGLYLLARVAARWGVDEAAPTRVWFELERDGRPLACA